MDKEFFLARFNELSGDLTQLVSKQPFEMGVLLGATGMAIIWWIVSLTSGSQAKENAVNSGSSRNAKSPTIEDVREKARRRL